MYVLITGRDSSLKRPKCVSNDRLKLAKKAHEFFTTYGFEIRDGKAYDEGNEDGGGGRV